MTSPVPTHPMSTLTPTLPPNFSCHNLRHAFAIQLCESGINLKVIQVVLGQADVKTTMNIYIDVTKGMKKKEMAAFEAFLNTGAGVSPPEEGGI